MTYPDILTCPIFCVGFSVFLNSPWFVRLFDSLGTLSFAPSAINGSTRFPSVPTVSSNSQSIRCQSEGTAGTCANSCTCPFDDCRFMLQFAVFPSGSIFLLKMSTEFKTLAFRRESSDLGKVFPSGVRVGDTSYGMGVFAFAFIPKGTPIARVSGHLINDPNYGSDYCIDAGDDKVLEPEPPFCYLNHACEPNCQLMQYVREADAEESEDMEFGELTEEDMDLDDQCEFIDDDCIYGGAEDDEILEDEILEEADETESDEQVFEDDADAEIWVESIQDIMLDEELTIDYAWPADRAAKCLCGTPQCRGWIVDAAEREHLPR